MGLSNFPSPGEGVLPLLVMNTVMSVALVKSKLRSVLQVVGGASSSASASASAPAQDQDFEDGGSSRARRVSITRYGSLWGPAPECCVCLCRFEADEEVSELSCKHFFHKSCLDKWFHNQHITCPLCRSIM